MKKKATVADLKPEPITVEDTGLVMYEVRVNDRDATLKCALILLQEFCQEMRPPYMLRRIMEHTRSKAKALGIKDSDKVIGELEKMVVQERYKNVKNVALDSMKGFW